MLDRAHVGDIEGALGTVGCFDTGPRRTLGRRVAAMLAIMGPGLVVMIADNDAGGLAVYSQAGRSYGTSLLWVIVVLAPVLFINQEMVARLGAVTGAGHARLIVERFGHRWGAFAIGDLLVLNALTIVTEFIGIALALQYFDINRYLAVPIAAAMLVGVTAAGSFRRWERAMYVLIALSFLVVPLVALAHSAHRSSALGGLAPGVQGGLSSSSILLIVALAGTTVAPWQLFFQQSNVVDKRITPRWLGYARIDTLLGTIAVTLGAIAIMLTCAWALGGAGAHGHFSDAGQVAGGLRNSVSPLAGGLFAIILLNASLLGAAIITLSSSYAVGDYFGWRQSLHRTWREATVFHATYALTIVGAAIVVLLPGAPLGLITIGVQALAGVLLPSASVFLLLLCNDHHVLGPWVNPRWLNALATLAVGVLVTLSTALTIITMFPHLDVATVCLVLFAILGLALAAVAAFTLPRHSAGTEAVEVASLRSAWTMPPLETLQRPAPSRSRRIALICIRAQLLTAVAVLVARLAEVMLRGS